MVEAAGVEPASWPVQKFYKIFILACLVGKWHYVKFHISLGNSEAQVVM